MHCARWMKTTLDHLDASHSSLVNLVALPIDRSRSMRGSLPEWEEAMCASIIKISGSARAMNIEATAEG